MEDGVRMRLQQAALELFAEKGFERTTAAGIAARAGVTERTFFRHFPDKREVLFDGQEILRAMLTEAIGVAPAEEPPLDTLFRAFRSVSPALEANRAYSVPRQAVISATPALRERELTKMMVLADAMADALAGRGIPKLRATLAGHIAMMAFAHAVIAWLEDAEPDLGERLNLSYRELNALLRLPP